MPEISQKMMMRGILIGILNNYRSTDSPKNTEIKKDVETLKRFKDKEYLAKVLFKEITDLKSAFASVCAIFLLEAVDKNSFEKQAIEFLKDDKTSDDKKFYIISLLKQKGINFDMDEISDYIQNSKQAAEDTIKDFLLNALDNPDVQIDLLDFFINIDENERKNFLENLLEDFKDDNLTNALSILVQTDVDDEELELIIEGLTSSNSPYALEGLNYILKNYSINEPTKKTIKRKIKEINFANPNFKNGLLVKNSRIYKCFISFCDGQANFPLVASRKKDNGLIDVLFLTANIDLGITSCMGFSKITEENFNSIISRLFTDSLALDINPIALKALVCHYERKNKEKNTLLPFEFIVWKKILTDVRELNYDISEFLNRKLESINLKEKKVLALTNAKVTETWYYSYRQNKHVDDIINTIEKEHICDIDKINKIVSDSIDNNFLNNEEFLAQLRSRLLIQSYAASLANLKITSSALYSLCFKNPYLKMFVTSMIDKSIYYYLSTRLYEYNKKNNKNFKQIIKTNFSKKELLTLMENLEDKWKQKKE